MGESDQKVKCFKVKIFRVKKMVMPGVNFLEFRVGEIKNFNG
jgi:hypothetical protein